MDYVSSSKPQAPLFTQIAIPLVIYLNILERMFTLHFKYGLAALLIVVLCATSYTLRNTLTWKDLATFLFLCIIILWSHVTQKDAISMVRGFICLMTGYLIGLTIIHTAWSKWPFRLLFIGMVALVLYGVLIDGINLKQTSLLYRMNRNSIPLFTFIISALIYVTDHMRGVRRPVIWPSLLSLACAILSQSRAGLLVTALFFVIVLGINVSVFYRKNKTVQQASPEKRIAFSLIFLAVLIAFLYVTIKNSRIATEGLHSSGRSAYVRAVLEELTFKRFITGFRPSILDQPDVVNLHNSYLRIITFTGILSIPIFTAIIASLVTFAKRSFLLFGILGLLCIYFLVESIIIFGAADSIFIPILMVAWQYETKPIPLISQYRQWKKTKEQNSDDVPS